MEQCCLTLENLRLTAYLHCCGRGRQRSGAVSGCAPFGPAACNFIVSRAVWLAKLLMNFNLHGTSLVALLVTALAQPVEGATPTRPNVLFIAIDDLNHWIGYLGRNPQTKTPHIDKLAARGVWFSRSYCAAPVCN